MKSERKQVVRRESFSPAEERAARSERIKVYEAEPYGWIAFSESGNEKNYHLFVDPAARSLVCTCADYIFRGGDDHRYECKHVSAVLKYIGRIYLAEEYQPETQKARAA